MGIIVREGVCSLADLPLIIFILNLSYFDDFGSMATRYANLCRQNPFNTLQTKIGRNLTTTDQYSMVLSDVGGVKCGDYF